MSDDLRAATTAAAERWRQTKAEPWTTVYDERPSSGWPARMVADMWALADAYLAANPADDGEAPTPEWALTLPGAYKPSDLSARVRVPVGVGLAVDLTRWEPGLAADIREADEKGNPTGGRVGLPQTFTTRGAVRRLLAAMGVPANGGRTT